VPLIGADKKPLTKEESAKVIEAAIRKDIKKPTGELTKAALEKVKEMAGACPGQALAMES